MCCLQVTKVMSGTNDTAAIKGILYVAAVSNKTEAIHMHTNRQSDALDFLLVLPDMSFCRGSVNCHGSDGQMYHFCESSRSGEIFLDQYRGGGGGLYSP